MEANKLKKFKVFIEGYYGRIYTKREDCPFQDGEVNSFIVLAPSQEQANRAVKENFQRLYDKDIKETRTIIGVKGVVNFRPDNWYASEANMAQKVLSCLGRKLVTA